MNNDNSGKSGKQRLDPEDRRFFHLLAEVIFSNPFSFDRNSFDDELGAVINTVTDDHHYTALVRPMEQRLHRLEQQGINRIQDVHGRDRALIEYAYRFQVYHDFVEDFDALILTQLGMGSEPAEVPFAKDLLGRLHKRGFSEQDALRNLALFYQIRRAYYFIEQALSGEAPCMKQLRHALWNNIFTYDMRLYLEHMLDRMEDFSTLLLGETGTGKGTAAAAIGRSGLIPFDTRKNRFKVSFTETFVSMNLSEFPETLIESELFGHRKGAFTGAVDNYKGMFERCSMHGSLFLDEIGDVPVPVQIKLLNVLQERRFTPVGSHEQRRFDGRVIAATNRKIDELRERGEFRDDFFYRLSSDVIQVPSLSERLQESPGELESLVGLLIERLTGEMSGHLADMVITSLEKTLPAGYDWPGNVRELEQAVRRIVLNGEYRVPGKAVRSEVEWVNLAANGKLTAQELMSSYCRMLYEQFGTYEEVAARAALDRRTVKKYISQ